MRTLGRCILVLLAVAAGLWSWNYLTVQRPLDGALAEDARNAGLVVRGHYQHWVEPGTLVFDVRTVRPTHRPIDVDRAFLQTAQALKARRFARVVLAYQGTPKFLLGGDHFQTLGEEYGEQNPVYTLRTLPEHLQRPDGTPAFGTWTGGLLGVTLRQMEDLSAFHQQWFLADLAR